MAVTKYDLAVIVNNYFIINGIAPKHPVTPDACADFARNCFSLILDIPNDGNAKNKLVQYMISAANYYGIDLNKALEYIKTVPVNEIFIQYCKDNFVVTGIPLPELVKDAFSYIGQTLSGSIWALLKPFFPLAILGIVGIYAFNKANK